VVEAPKRRSREVGRQANDRHHRVAGVEFDFRKRWPPPLRWMAWFGLFRDPFPDDHFWFQATWIVLFKHADSLEDFVAFQFDNEGKPF
jgi:hypothetical protein